MCIRTLSTHGYEVDAVENGIEALERLLTIEYDACFSDITMPGLNGIEIFKILKEQYPGKANRIVFTTGDMLNPEVKKFVQLNSSLVLAKPFLPEELVLIIRRLIENNLVEV